MELPTFSNVILPNTEMKGAWADYFKNDHPITLELGCGKGEYTLALARLYPERNFIGIDYQSERLWVGAKAALAEQLPNVAWLRIRTEAIDNHFASGEVGEIWITFPDPYPRKKQAKHRLTSPAFLAVYKQILVPAGMVHVKTDDEQLFRYTRETVQASGGKVEEEIVDVHGQRAPSRRSVGTPRSHIGAIQTTFEKRHIAAGKKILYLSFSFDK